MVPARTVVLAGLAEVLAKRAGTRLRMVPASRAIRGGVRPHAPAVPPRPMARAGIRRGTRAGVARRLRRVRVRTVAGRPARPAVTDHAGTLGLLPAANPETAGRPRAASTEAAAILQAEDPAAAQARAQARRAASPGAAGPPRVANIGAVAILRAEHLGAARVPEPVGPEAAGPPAASRAWAEARRAAITAAAPGLPTTVRLVLPLLARPAKAPASGPQRAADRAVRRRGVSAATLMRAATSVAAGGQRTPDHGGPPRVTQGAAQVAPDAPRATLVEATTGQAPTIGQAVVTGQVPATRPGPASGARTRPQPAVTAQAMHLGRMFRTRLALTSSTRKRALS